MNLPLASGQSLVVECSCGATYTEEQWKDLRYVGVNTFEDQPSLELRNCAECHSTRGVWRNADGKICDENGAAL